MKPIKSIEELEFPGSIGNMAFKSISMNEFINALNKNGWHEGSHTKRYHFFHSLVERGTMFGIATPNDLARALRDGYTLPTKNGYLKRVCRGGACLVIYNGNEFITLCHAKDEG
ncbi:MAG TPA: hypothetical protein VNX46_08905 [Candidatus Acidoferrum sp.]|nr:hypothetical protein [Candidatus Acidoferrum sp.]